MAEAGKGSPYARWFEKMLRVTESDGLPSAYADWSCSDVRLSILCGPMVTEIPLPPPFRSAGD